MFELCFSIGFGFIWWKNQLTAALDYGTMIFCF